MTSLYAGAWFALGYLSAIVTVLGLFVWAALRLRGDDTDRTEMEGDFSPLAAAQRDETRGPA